MIIHTLPNGDSVHRFDANIVIPFRGRRRVLSTSPHNGGYREDLQAVFNHDGRQSLGVKSQMKAPTFREHMQVTIREMGLNIETTTGMETAARMENASVKTAAYEDLTVTAIVTGGISTNGGRVGDPGPFVEKSDVAPEYRLGTINIFLLINADCSPGCMARALVTCTEAKTAAIQELIAESKYGRGIATGSGTDSTIVVADMESGNYLTNAGKHSKLGELIGNAVKPAVKEALFLQTGLSPEYQHNAVQRLHRFGVDESTIYHSYIADKPSEPVSRPIFADELERVIIKTQSVVLASFIAHLIDQMDWELLSVKETTQSAVTLLEDYAKSHGLEVNLSDISTATADDAVVEIANAWTKVTISEVMAGL